MNDILKIQSINSLKDYAKYKNSYENCPDNLNVNGSVINGNLYNGFQDIKLFKSDVIFSIRWTNKIGKLYFLNICFQDMNNKSVFSSEEILFEFKNNKLEFTAGGSHWTLE